MGTYNFISLGTSSNNKKQKYIEQFFNCWEINCNMGFEEHVGKLEENFSPHISGLLENEMLCGINYNKLDTIKSFALKMYYFLNKLFGETFLYCEYEFGTTITDAYYRYEYVYDPQNKKVFESFTDYDMTFYNKRSGKTAKKLHDVSEIGLDNIAFSKFVKMSIDTAKQKGYSELVELINEKIK